MKKSSLISKISKEKTDEIIQKEVNFEINEQPSLPSQRSNRYNDESDTAIKKVSFSPTALRKSYEVKNRVLIEKKPNI